MGEGGGGQVKDKIGRRMSRANEWEGRGKALGGWIMEDRINHMATQSYSKPLISKYQRDDLKPSWE